MQELGPHFSLDLFLKARDYTIRAVHEVASKVEIGMNENDGHLLIDQTLEKLGSEKKWHPNKLSLIHI